MIDMSRNVDIYVCNPSIAINKSLEAVCLVFEVMDRETQEGTGKTHTVAMPTPDAMQLLRNLQYLQAQFGLAPAEADPVELKGGPGQKN